MNYVLGLDVGIASVGWAVLELNEEDNPIRIEGLGARIFDKAEVPKTGASLAAPRRMSRGIRRVIRRRRFRLQRVRSYLKRHNILPAEKVDHLYDVPSAIDIYELRKRALTEKVTAEEWARLLIFFAKHRGFKSNRKKASGDADEGEMLKAIAANAEILKNYRTVGEMLCDNEKFRKRKRNRDGAYNFTVSRAMLMEEIHTLFEIQRNLGQKFADEKIEEEYVILFAAQRKFDEGQGENSPYAGNQIEKMIGSCTLEGKKEKRAPKASYAFMAFNLWQKINHLKINRRGSERFLTEEERRRIADLAWKKEKLTYGSLREVLFLDPEDRFVGLRYDLKKEKEEDLEEPVSEAEKMSFSWVKDYHSIRKALDKVEKNRILKLSHEQLDTIATAFSVYKNEETIEKYLEEGGIEKADREALLERLSGFSKFGHLSLKACYKILPFLEKGEVYSRACERAGYDFSKSSLENIDDIPNPVVKRSISQTLKVINAIILRYGNPVEVHIELARELARNFRDRKKIEKGMQENQAKNEKIRQRLISEFGVLRPKGMDIVKFKLCEEQNGECAYSQKHFDMEKLLRDPSYAEVDHIIPYSRSFDDSYNNKVLVLTKENREKRNRIPMEYLADAPERKNRFIHWVKSTIRNSRKRENLLRIDYTETTENEWKRRNLQDTQYISKYLYNYLRHHLVLAKGYTERKRRIIPVNGAVTAYFRKRLGINKIRENGDLHHAVDAVIIACATQGIVNKVSRYSKSRELWDYEVDMETGEVLQKKNKNTKDVFPEPWLNFRYELEQKVRIRPLDIPKTADITEMEEPFVSHMPNRKIHGPAHKETIRSGRLKEEGYTISKTALIDLKLTEDKEEIKGYYNKESDRLLYEALKKQLQRYGGKAKEAFKEPFHKPKADGTPGPIVNKVKIMEKSTMLIPVNGGKGLASNGNMVRIDVFRVEEKGKKKYYFIPVYVADTVKEELPNRAVLAHKPYEAWKIMKEEDFIFSLYPNDLIFVDAGKGIPFKAALKGSTLDPEKKASRFLMYYKGADIATGSISGVNHDETYKARGIGIQSLREIKKCCIDVLGNISFASKEKRQTFR